MWLILLLRVVCPVFPESYFSIYNLIPVGKEVMLTLTYDEWMSRDTTIPDVSVEQSDIELLQNSTDEMNISEENKQPVTAESPFINESNHSFDACSVILIVYVTGVLLTCGFHFFLYRKAVHVLMRHTSPCFDNQLEKLYCGIANKLGIRNAPELYMGKTSMTIGFLKPKIVLRRDTEAGHKEYDMVLTHELNHYKHFDNQILLLSTVVCCIFWYNPMLWIVRKYLREDIELLCDMRTLSVCEIESTDYAMLLYRYSQFGEVRTVVGSPMSTSGKRLKKRLMTIAIHNKHRFLSRTTSFLLTAAIVMVCLTNPIVSKVHEYKEYVENFASLTGISEKAIYGDEHVSVHEFLGYINKILLNVGGESLAQKMGGGSLENLKRIAAASEYIDEKTTKEIMQLQASVFLRASSCALILDCVADLLSENSSAGNPTLLPSMITVSTFESLCKKLTAEEADMLKSCYNLGISGVDISFNYLYSNAMMELIMTRINDEWSREKLLGYYTEINLSPSQLDVLSSRLNETIRYVELGSEFYICTPDIRKNEENILREILGAAVAGQREDVYYLKETEDGCSYETAQTLFRKTGFTITDMFEEYSRIGGTTYRYITPENYTLISEYDVRLYSERLSDPTLVEIFSENFIYHENYVYKGEDDTELTIPFRYYTVGEENSDICRTTMANMLERLNAVAFPQLYELETLEMTGSYSETVRSAAINCIQRGFMESPEEKMDMREDITSGRCAKILCRFLASMTNVSK